MARYTALPKIVEAVRFASVQGDEATFEIGEGSDHWLMEALDKKVGSPGSIWSLGGGLRVATLEGTLRVDVGDYIVRGTHNELYPVKPEIFNTSFRPLVGV